MTVVNDVPEESCDIVISTRCKKCEVGFTRATILKHISHAESCKDSYTREELLLYQEWAKEKVLETKKKSYSYDPSAYDPEKRRKIYLDRKDKVNIFIDN